MKILKIKIHNDNLIKKKTNAICKKKMSQEIYISTYLFGQLKTPIFQTNKTTYLYLKPKPCNISTHQLISCKNKHIIMETVQISTRSLFGLFPA